MSKQRHEEEMTIELRLWTNADAVKAVPYVRSIVGSLREDWLELRRAWLQLRRLDGRPGRPDRHALIGRAEAARDLTLAEDRFEDALNELTALDVYCLDPAQGLALIPFRRGEDLAWFVFDLFAPRGLTAWRFHKDPLEMRRPLAEQLGDELGDGRANKAAEKLDPGLVDEVFSI